MTGDWNIIWELYEAVGQHSFQDQFPAPPALTDCVESRRGVRDRRASLEDEIDGHWPWPFLALYWQIDYFLVWKWKTNNDNEKMEMFFKNLKENLVQSRLRGRLALVISHSSHLREHSQSSLVTTPTRVCESPASPGQPSAEINIHYFIHK